MNKLKHQKKKILLGLLLLFLAFSCQKGEDYSKIKEQANKIASLSELGTVEYVISKIVKAADNETWFKYGDRKILFTCKASLKAGIDLSKLNENDIKTNFSEKSISIILPKAKPLSISIRPDDVSLVYEKVSLTRSSFSNSDRDMIMAQGEKDIWEGAEDFGILKDAETNAKSFLEALLKQAGYEKISVEFKNKEVL
jgi:hypothetical protein